MTKRVAPKLITVTKKLSQNQKQNRWWSCVTFLVSTRFTATSPAQPSPAQHSCYSATGVGVCWRLLCFYSILLCVLPLVFRSRE